nr:hypothetical protein BaRGS_034150 [Batillaria attramentaria]
MNVQTDVSLRIAANRFFLVFFHLFLGVPLFIVHLRWKVLLLMALAQTAGEKPARNTSGKNFASSASPADCQSAGTAGKTVVKQLISTLKNQRALSFFLDQIPATGNYVIMIHLYCHFFNVHPGIYAYHVRDAARGVVMGVSEINKRRVWILSAFALVAAASYYWMTRSKTVVKQLMSTLRNHRALSFFLDQIPATGNYVIMIHLYSHFFNVHPGIYAYHVRDAARGVVMGVSEINKRRLWILSVFALVAAASYYWITRRKPTVKELISTQNNHRALSFFLDQIPATGKYIIMIHLYSHFFNVHPGIYAYHVRDAARGASLE